MAIIFLWRIFRKNKKIVCLYESIQALTDEKLVIILQNL